MKKRKVVLFSAFILMNATLIATSLTGCNTNEVEKTGFVSVDKNIANGVVSISLSGEVKVDTLVTILAIPNEGYEVDSYFLNGKKIESDTFKVVEGKNNVSATFKAKEAETLYGTVEILDDEVLNGEIIAYLKDGVTEINNENKRLEVGSKVVVKFIPKDKTYEIKELKLNDSNLTIDSNQATFEVIEGRNFLSAKFDFINPGKGLVELSEFSNGNVEILQNGSVINNSTYIDEGVKLTLKATPSNNYVVKHIKLNSVSLERIKLDGNTYIYELEVLEGYNYLDISFANEANSIEINIPEDWIAKEIYSGQYRYDVEANTTYNLTATLLPEGSYADLVWSKNDYDDDIEITSDGELTILNGSETNCTVKVALKDNPEIYETVSIKPISSGAFQAQKLLEKLKVAKEFELENTKKVKFKEKVKDEYSDENNTFAFETYSDGHSITSLTDKDGQVSYLYEGKEDNNFYQLKKVGTTVSVINKKDIESSDIKEVEDLIKTFGSVEFLDNNGMGNKYFGLADYYSKAIIEEYFAFGDDGSGGIPEIRKNLDVIRDTDGYKFISNCITSGLFQKKYATEVISTISFNRDGAIDNFTFLRTDKLLDSEGNVDATTEANITEYSAEIEYGEKSVDANNYFNFDNYYLRNFDLELFNDKNNSAENKILPSNDGVYELVVGKDYYLNIANYEPETFISKIDELQSSYISKEEGGNLYLSSSYSNNGFNLKPYKPGDYEVTIKSKNVTKTIKVNVKYAPIDRVEFDSNTPDKMFAGSKIKINAKALPTESIENKDVSYEIVGEALGCTIVEETNQWGSKTVYLQAGDTSGEITLRAKAVGDDTKYIDKKIKIEEIPAINDLVVGKTFIGSIFDYNTYASTVFTLNISGSNNVYTGTIKVSEESYYGDPEIICTYSFNARFEGSKILLDSLNCDKTDYSSSLENTIVAILDSTGKVDSLTITFNNEVVELNEESSSGGYWF